MRTLVWGSDSQSRHFNSVVSTAGTPATNPRMQGESRDEVKEPTEPGLWSRPHDTAAISSGNFYLNLVRPLQTKLTNERQW